MNSSVPAHSSRRRLLWTAASLLLLVAGAAYALSRSTLARSEASARFSPGERGMNRLTVDAPYGTHVVTYSVVPRVPADGPHPFQVGSRSGSRPIGLFGEDQSQSNGYPAEGGVESFPLERHVQISKQLDTAATAALPEDRKLLERCGLYAIVTRDPEMYSKVEGLVSQWTADAGAQPGP